MRYLGVVFLAVVLPVHAAWLDEWEAAQNQAVLDWQAAASELAEQVQIACADREFLSAEQRQSVQPAWQHLVSQWGVITTQSPAVIDELGLGYRVAFWPDSRGIVGRQMQTHQQERAEGTYQSLQLAGHGIQAVDWLLAQPEPDCVLLLDWAEVYQGYLDQITEQLPLRLTPADRALTLATNDLYAQASRINQRLREVIPEADGRYRPFMGDVSETGQSLTLVKAALNDLARRIVEVTDGFPDDSQDRTADSLSSDVQQLADQLPEGWPMDDAEAAWDISTRIRAVNVAVETWLSDDVAARYSLLIGFNNQDGD
ncbi:hypothetical protein BGP77_02655 [Saccharospirillum sp. MSK14-1]|uniref:imelysin family protein n=1 Tax=Saccharospirillum sp. MSK14-1 TaxID=1897632 RepID=UPI000D3BDB02|nr:hypothetical protein BGP77_02655 [Saccharospirillum sp. MSK14-1]